MPDSSKHGVRFEQGAVDMVTVIALSGLLIALGVIRHTYYSVIFSSGMADKGKLLPLALLFLILPISCGIYSIVKKSGLKGAIFILLSCGLPIAYRFYLEIALVGAAKDGKVKMFQDIGSPISQ